MKLYNIFQSIGFEFRQSFLYPAWESVKNIFIFTKLNIINMDKIKPVKLQSIQSN